MWLRRALRNLHFEKLPLSSVRDMRSLAPMAVSMCGRFTALGKRLALLQAILLIAKAGLTFELIWVDFTAIRCSTLFEFESNQSIPQIVNVLT